MGVVGDGPDGERLERRLAALGLGGQVRLHGPVPREQLPQLLQRAHAAVLPSRLDGMSWALLEAMACGCVPITTRIRETTDMLVRDGENGFLCRPGDAGQFARAIEAIARDRARLERMSQASRETIEDGFTSDRMVDAHDRAFDEIRMRPRDRVPGPDRTGARARKAFQRSWRSYVPRPIRNAARTWAERFGRTL
jgi:glycosyltransferase involved in cell wall biosynthesis